MRRRRSWPLRVARVAGWLILTPLLVVTVALTAAILFARTDAGREQVRRLVLAEARRTIPGLDLRRIDGDYVHGLTLRDVDVRDQQGRVAVHVDTVAAHFDLLALRHRTIAVAELRIEGTRLVVHPTETGALNIATLIKPAPAAAVATAPTPPRPSRWRVRIDQLQIVDLGADVALADGTRAAIPGLDLSARVNLDGDRLAVRLRELEVSGDGSGRLFGEGDAALDNIGLGSPRLGAYRAVVSAQNLDPAQLFNRAPAGRLLATASVNGTGPPLADGSEARIDLHIAPSEIAGTAVTSGTVRARASGPRWQIEQADLAAPGIAATLRGQGHDRWVAVDLDARLKTPLPALAGRAPPPIHGSGSLSAHVEGTLPDANLTLAARVSGLRAGDVRVTGADLTARVQRPLSAPTGDVRLHASGIVLGPDAPRVDRLTLTAAGDRRGLRVGASAAGPGVRGSLQARGTLAPGTVDARLLALDLDVTTRRYRQTVALQRPARVRVRAGEGVAWTDVALRGAGYRFSGEATTSGVFRPPPVRRGAIAELQLRLRQASFNGVPPVDADLSAALLARRATATLDASMPAARARVHLDAELPLVIPAHGAPRLAASGPVALNLRSDDVRLESVPALQEILRRNGVSGGVASLNLAVTGDVAHPDARAAFDLRDVMYRNIRGVGRDATIKTVPGLGGRLDLQTDPGAVSAALVLRIRNAGVLTAQARTPVDLRALLGGKVDLRVLPLQATLTIPAFALQSLSEFTDDMKGVSGQLSGQATLTGTLARPAGSAQVRIADGKVDDLRFGPIELQAQSQSGRIQAKVVMPQATGGRLTGAATLDRRDGDRLQATVEARDLDLRFARLLAPTLRETGGVAFLSASAGGRLAQPVVKADLRVQRGRVGIIGQPTFHDVSLAATLRPGRAELTALEARSGDGTLSGSGWVTLDGLQPQRAVFKARAHRFLVAAAGSTGALIDGEIAAEAALRRNVLAGKVDVPRAQVWLPKGPTAGGARKLQKIGAHADVRFVDQAAQAAAERDRDKAATPHVLELGVRTGPIYVRGKDLDLELDSALTVGSVNSGPRAGAATVSGAIHVRRGRINIQGQRFDVTRGEITFDGSPDLTPHFDVRLERQYPDARVALGLRGTPQKPSLELTSDPPVYDRAQIVSLILTGQPGGQPSDGRSFDAASAVATAVLSRLADTIAPEIGLDVLRVEAGKDGGDSTAGKMADTRVEIGKYVTDRIYLSYAHIFGAPEAANQNEAHVEYRLTRRWMVETIFGDAGVGGVDALWTVRY